MKKHFFYRPVLFCLLWLLSFSACSIQEDAVVPLPEDTCDTMATVQLVPSCGLLLVLENNQKLVPLNVSVTTSATGTPVYKIDGFAVQVGQQIIVGYKTANVEVGPTPCNQTGYYNNTLVNITCIVSLEPQT